MAKNNSTFKVPENYFNDLEKDILSKVNQLPKKNYIFSPSKSIFRYAAIVLLFLAVGGIIWWSQPSDLNYLQKQYSLAKTKDSTNNELANHSINENKNFSSKENSNKSIDIKTEEISTSKKENTISQMEKEKSSNEDFELSKEELEYLEYYLQADVVHDYLTYNEIEL